MKSLKKRINGWRPDLLNPAPHGRKLATHHFGLVLVFVMHHLRQKVAFRFWFLALFNQLYPAPWVVLHHLVFNFFIRAHCLVLCHAKGPFSVGALGLSHKLRHLKNSHRRHHTEKKRGTLMVFLSPLCVTCQHSSKSNFEYFRTFSITFYFDEGF